MAELNIKEINGGVIFTAKVIPGSSSPEKICGVLDGMLKIKVSAAPEKGKANQCLIKFLAGILDVKKNSIQIISGQTSPIKKIQISGISIDTLMKKLVIKEQPITK
ncbi:MAG: DUF167 domain-containing protein [Sedimentisphaerales bacterium]|nr:DUF167 domain-containing protein [Sedimentisphaerales bacterium]